MGYFLCDYLSPLGLIKFASDGDALAGLWFADQKRCANVPQGGISKSNIPVFEETIRWLDLYFSGKDPGFTPRLAPRGSKFQREVWDILLTIPYGGTVTYGNIASLLASRRGLAKMSAQAVGRAVGSNPIALIVPCHRVIGSNGSLVGYAGGLGRKATLLDLEKHVDC